MDFRRPKPLGFRPLGSSRDPLAAFRASTCQSLETGRSDFVSALRQHCGFRNAMSNPQHPDDDAGDAEERKDARHQENFPRRLAFGVWQDPSTSQKTEIRFSASNTP